jgi:hypothetical protein
MGDHARTHVPGAECVPDLPDDGAPAVGKGDPVPSRTGTVHSEVAAGVGQLRRGGADPQRRIPDGRLERRRTDVEREHDSRHRFHH